MCVCVCARKHQYSIRGVSDEPSAVDIVQDLRAVLTHMDSTCLCEHEEEARRKVTPQLLYSQGLAFPPLTPL